MGPLAWLALVPLNLSLTGAGRCGGFLRGAVSGGVFFAVHLFWVYETLVRYSGMPAWLCPLPWLLLVGYLALFPAMYGTAIAGIAARDPVTALWWSPVAWTGLEWIRGTALTGFPWGLLGASQHDLPLTSQGASLAGTYGLSFLIGAFSAGLSVAVLVGARGRTGLRALAASAAILSMTLAWGAVRLSRPTPSVDPLTVGCVQGNTPPDGSGDEAAGALRIHVDLSRQAAREGARLILWPESSTPYMLEEDRLFRRLLEMLAEETGASLAVGSVGGSGEGPWANSVFLLDPGDGPARVRYDKTHLVPYGEYVPMARVTPFVRRFVDAIGDFVPGSGPVVWAIPGARVAPLICYEAIFPPIARRAVEEGADILINVTNDGWYGTTSGPRQHLALARLRAIETARPLVRAANTGISAVFDRNGRLLASLDAGRRGLVVAEVVVGTTRTPYMVIGDSLPIACAIITPFLMFPPLRSRRDPDGAAVDGDVTEGPEEPPPPQSRTQG